MTLSLTSPAFPPTGDIPKEYTCDGKNPAAPSSGAELLQTPSASRTYRRGK